jgi:hypothetical protein
MDQNMEHVKDLQIEKQSTLKEEDMQEIRRFSICK